MPREHMTVAVCGLPFASGFAETSGEPTGRVLEDLCSYHSLLRISITQVVIARESNDMVVNVR